MTDNIRRSILEDVAAGRLTPTEAADRLAALDADAAGSRATTEAATDTATETGTDTGTGTRTETRTERVVVGHGDASPSRVLRVKVEGNFRAVEVLGDDEVRDAVAEGPHRSRLEGDVLVIDGSSPFDDDGEPGADRDWYEATNRRSNVRVRVGGRTVIGGRGAGAGGYRPRPLRVRMNPDLHLDARVEAGPLVIKRVRGPVSARVAAGPLTITGFESPIDVKVSAGKVTARGRVDHGESHIDCDAGKVRLHLEEGTHARVRAQATLGKVGLGEHQERDLGLRKDEFRRLKRDLHDIRDLGDLGSLHDLGDRLSDLLSGAFSDTHEVTVGRGTGSIDIQVSMGAADITFDDEVR